MIPDRDQDHVGQGLGLLITQYRDKPRLAAWARAYLRQCQLLEDAIYDVLIKRIIDNAVGVQVDVIGKIVGEMRRGRSDDEYKVFITARVRINRSRGNTSDVLAILAMVTTTPVTFREYAPAALSFEMTTIPDHDPVMIYLMMRDAKAAGVKLTMIVPTTNTKQFQPMSYDGTSNPDHALADARNTPASIVGAAEPFALADGMVLTVAFNGAAPTLIAFKAADFVDITHATALEVVRAINKQYRRPWVASVSNSPTPGSIMLSTYLLGTGASIDVTNDSTNDVLGFETPVYGTGADITFGLASDAVTVRDPMAVPIDPLPGPPTVLYVDPGYET